MMIILLIKHIVTLFNKKDVDLVVSFKTTPPLSLIPTILYVIVQGYLKHGLIQDKLPELKSTVTLSTPEIPKNDL